MVLAASGVEHEELLSVAEPLLSDLPSVPRPEEPKSIYVGGDFRRQGESVMCCKGMVHMLLLLLKCLVAGKKRKILKFSLFYRKPLELFLKAVDEITLNDITKIAQKIISSPLTMASYGDVVNVPSDESVNSKFHAK